MKDNIAVSIIVPIYNAEHFLKKGIGFLCEPDYAEYRDYLCK